MSVGFGIAKVACGSKSLGADFLCSGVGSLVAKKGPPDFSMGRRLLAAPTDRCRCYLRLTICMTTEKCSLSSLKPIVIST